MERQRTGERYSPEVRARAVRMVVEHASEYGSQWAAISSISGKIGYTAETLRRWVRQAERDEGLKPGPTSAVRWTLGRPGIFLNSAGDVDLLPAVLRAAGDLADPPGDDFMAGLSDRAGLSSIFGR